MFLGKPVIGTAYSGNLEFMNKMNSLLVDYRLIPVGAREYPFPEGQMWAEPDIAQGRRHDAAPRPGSGRARELGVRARAHMLEQFSAEAIGAGISARVGQILDGDV